MRAGLQPRSAVLSVLFGLAAFALAAQAAGTVYDVKGDPIPGAWLDFWQADGAGRYDNTGFQFRGHQFTDAAGRYVLKTVISGEYPGRTPHIHVKLRSETPRIPSSTGASSSRMGVSTS
jgi:hypothetical protein